MTKTTSRVHFTADTHFAHENIIQFCHHPFTPIDEHDRAQIESWNAIVAPNDTAFHVGNFAYTSDPRWLKHMFYALNGHKRLVLGNLTTNQGTRSDGSR